MDARFIMAFGACLLAWSLWRLSQWTPAVNEWTLIYNTMVQGAGIGFIFVPLNVVAFATLEPKLRYEATAFLTLVRSIGMSMGISIFEALVTQNTQVEHSVLAVFASPLNRAIAAAPQVAHALSPMSVHGAALLDQDDQLPVAGDRLQQRFLADGDHVGADPAAGVPDAEAAGRQGRRTCSHGLERDPRRWNR